MAPELSGVPCSDVSAGLAAAAAATFAAASDRLPVAAARAGCGMAVDASCVLPPLVCAPASRRAVLPPGLDADAAAVAGGPRWQSVTASCPQIWNLQDSANRIQSMRMQRLHLRAARPVPEVMA